MNLPHTVQVCANLTAAFSTKQVDICLVANHLSQTTKLLRLRCITRLLLLSASNMTELTAQPDDSR